MGFMGDMQSRAGHEALLGRQDAELRLLENMRRCISSRVKCDREYSSALTAIAAQGQKAGDDTLLAGSLVAQAWRGVLEELENAAKLVRANADAAEKETLEKLNTLYAEKRKARKSYQDEHARISLQVTNVVDEVNKKKAEYQKQLENYRLMRSRFEEHYVKSGRGGRKLDDVRDKYQRACRKLHLVHNEYVLLLVEAGEVEASFHSSLLPALLRHHQATQELFVKSWKNILREVARLWNFAAREFAEINVRVESQVEIIKPSSEYKDFTDRFKCDPAEPSGFTFDKSLVEDTSGKLLANQLTVDNLTVESVHSRAADLEARLRDIKERTNVPQETGELVTKSLQCEEVSLTKQLDVIRRAFSELGCEEPPSAIDLPESPDNNNMAEPPIGSSQRSLTEEEWFHGVLPREEVVRLLTHEGDFLVRETTRNAEHEMVLSVCWAGVSKHFIVQTTPEGQYRFEGPVFPSIQELIAYQYQSGLPVTSRSGAILRQPVPRERWELNNDDVLLLDKIGRGNFGDVYKARLRTTGQEVAAKTCRMTVPDDHKRKFLQEGRILKQYDHPNVVKFIGICVQKQPIMIVMELVVGGSLLTYLRNNAQSLTQRQLLLMCRDTAAGMRYLESRNCIHRDLAARNCLVGADNVVKISDFGMSREEEEYIVSDGMKQIPIKWTAPEALNFGKYTSLCDVWSYGVLTWEIFAKGGTPYPGLSNSKAREKIDQGYRMPATEGTPNEMYQLMLSCWEYQPEKRPHFDEIYARVEKIISNYR